jgi:hypothetical protein
MHKRRLLKLADLLEADAKNKKGVKFDMGNWGWTDDAKNPLSCGTSACAMGLAALSGKFKRAGLTYKFHGPALHFCWNGRDIDGIEAAEQLFEIDSSDAWDFFLPKEGEPDEGAKAERALAKRIRKFVAAAEESRS